LNRPEILAFALIAATLAMFVWGRFRYDLVALGSLLAGVLLVLFLSLAGIPPLVGFWAKFNLFAAVLGVSAGAVPFGLVVLAVALSAVSLYYYLQVLKRAYVMPAIDESPIKAHPVTMAVLLAIAAAVVVLGCFPELLQNWIQSFYPVN